MFKLVVLFALIAVASAGLINSGYSGLGVISSGHGGLGLISGGRSGLGLISSGHGGLGLINNGYGSSGYSHATSYANSNSLSLHPVPVVISRGISKLGGY
ncbi:hypothetical protein FQR65_LT07278 [Abscondita terminalis]|nr:hypothetical protein FQR65_LT07278 [Abscondita terminalis]